MRWRCGCARSASRPPRICCSCCRLRYEDRTRVVPLGELRPGQRAAVEGEVLLTEVVFRGRRQMLCKIADGSGFLTLALFLFHGAAAARPRARRAHPLLRRSAARPAGAGNRASGIPARRPAVARMPPEEHLTPIYPTHRRRDPRAAAPAGRHGPRSDRLPATSRTGCRRRVLADSRLPSLARCTAATCIGRPPMRRWNC